AVDRAVVVGGLAERRGVRARFERFPGRLLRVVVEAEDRAQVALRRARELEAVLARAGVRALVRADLARAVLGHAHAREDAAALQGAAVGAGVVLAEPPERDLIRDDRVLVLPLPADAFLFGIGGV